MTKDVGVVGRWFTVCRDYREDWGRWRYDGSLVSDHADDVRSSVAGHCGWDR
jgi:hypothetical protein